MSGIYDFSVKDIDGNTQSLEQYKGKVLLIVNVASKCGFTPQYKQLQELYNEYKDRGLEVLGFPCDQFGHQEPGDEEEIKHFCELNFGVTFPLFSKLEVNGKDADPLYQFLKSEAPGLMGTKKVKWNFTKFLVNKDGKPLERFSPQKTPKALEEKIKDLL
jgi:glutathione peroxidase